MRLNLGGGERDEVAAETEAREIGWRERVRVAVAGQVRRGRRRRVGVGEGDVAPVLRVLYGVAEVDGEEGGVVSVWGAGRCVLHHADGGAGEGGGRC